MKSILLFTLILLPVISYSQDLINDNFPTKDNLINYTEVVPVDSTLLADKLYLNAKKWLSVTFKSSKSVIQTDDKEAKLIIIKSFVEKGHNSMVSNPKNWFILKLEMKNGRYKYSLYDIRYEFDINLMGQSSHTDKPFEEWIRPSDPNISEKKRQKIYDSLVGYCKDLDSEFKVIIDSLKKNMANNEIDNW